MKYTQIVLPLIHLNQFLLAIVNFFLIHHAKFGLLNLPIIFFSTYVMVPIHPVHQGPAHIQPPTPTPTIYTYSHAQPSSASPPINHHEQPAYHAVKSIEYAVPSAPIAPLHTAVDYKNIQTIVPKHTLPSIATTSFRQYYSPGLEYHYTEIVPTTKLQASSMPSYSYHHAPTHNYHTSYVSQPSPYYYQNVPVYNKPSPNLYESFVPSAYAKQQSSYKNYYPSGPSIPQQLFTPAQQYPSSSQYQYPSQAYNTIAYSVPYPPYDHSKRSTKSTATATLNVKAPKSS
jgi:hypothetical protein